MALKFSIDTYTVEIEKDINKYLKLFPIYEPAIKLILGDKLYRHVYNFGSLQKIEEVDRIVNLPSKSYRLQCNQIYTLIKKKYYLRAAELLSELEKYYLKTDNTLAILQTYSLKLILMEECNSNEWIEETRKTLPIFKENIDKNKEQIITHIFNISMGCFNRKKYNLAFELLSFVLIESDELFLPTAIYLNNISTITGLDIPQQANKEEYPVENFPKEFNIIYNFYLLKNRGSPPEELENYIFENIRPIFINCSDDSLYQTFLIELEKCVSITGHKNLIYQYNRIKTRSIKS